MLSARVSPIGFIDVGAGGPLKDPWTFLPPSRVNKFNFEPEDQSVGGAPLCVSDHDGVTKLFIARDARSSSLQAASEQFMRRFHNEAIATVREVDVRCVTLDAFFAGQRPVIDLIDINAEGHDLYVLRGARALLAQGAVSLIKIEAEFTEVWHGQGWFSDIDQFLRNAGYDLVALDVDVDRPSAARHLYHDGELLWGKAFYVPAAGKWKSHLATRQAADPTAAEDCVLKAVVLYVITDTLGRAIDLLDLAERTGTLRRVPADEVRRWIGWVFQYAELEARAHDITRSLNIFQLGRTVLRTVVRR